jgi:membrane associated rhomboid family serine protease
VAARDDAPRTFFDSPVSAGTCALAIGVTGLYWAGKNIEPLTMTAAAFGREPWRLFTSALVHAHYKDSGFMGIFHILFNVAWTYRFGGALEARYGSLRTLLLFLMLAAGSSAAEFAIFRGGIGLSGVGFGLFGFLWMARRRTNEFDEVIDRRVIGGFVGWFFFCIASTYFGALRVANVAHGMGCLLGALAGAIATAPTPAKRTAWIVALLVALGITVACATVFRPIVNLGGFAL